jgi:hypothetical protein
MLDAQRRFLNEHGAQVGCVHEKKPETERGAVLTLDGVAAISSLADAIVRVVNESQRGGLVVDLRARDIRVRENESLERGQVLVVKGNGEVVSYVCTTGSNRKLAAIIAMPEVPSVYCLS